MLENLEKLENVAPLVQLLTTSAGKGWEPEEIETIGKDVIT